MFSFTFTTFFENLFTAETLVTATHWATLMFIIAMGWSHLLFISFHVFSGESTWDVFLFFFTMFSFTFTTFFENLFTAETLVTATHWAALMFLTFFTATHWATLMFIIAMGWSHLLFISFHVFSGESTWDVFLFFFTPM